MTQTIEIEEVITNLYQTIKHVGLKRFLHELRKMNLPEFEQIEQDLCSFIIETTAKHYRVRVKDMKASYVKGIALQARKMSFVILHKNIDCSMKNIAQLFGKTDHTLVSYAVKEWSSMTEEEGLEFKQSYDIINELVMKKKDELFLVQTHD